MRSTGSIANPIPISIVIPVFDPPLEYLAECIDSVLTQTASNWQLVVSDDGSTDPEVLAFLDEIQRVHARDPRIVIVQSSNGGISAACNRALEFVTSAWFGWLDHDDRLNPRAVELISQYLSAEPTADIIYSDEDKIDVSRRHFEL